jgi:ADP-ribosylglycohydrolase
MDPGRRHTTLLDDKAMGCLAGAAVGDALGGATEGWTAEQIRARYGGWVDDIVPAYEADTPRAERHSRYAKGDGRITDDTLMTQALVAVYRRCRRHLDAYDVADELIPELTGRTQWIPDMEREDAPFQRLFLAEKYLVARLQYGHVDPREAGVGNIVNCGAAMYMAPVGIVNAAAPETAYAEAIDLAGAHQSSYGREAAGVMAAAVAAAMAADATVDDVVEASLGVAHDGTRDAIRSVVACAQSLGDWRDGLAQLREAIAPFDTVGPEYRDPGLGARRPSRLHAIEELPIALGLLVIARGDYREAVLGAANYGRDSDSIATMAGAIAGALGGLEVVPEAWRRTVASASQLDLETPGREMAAVARELMEADERRRAARQDAFAVLTGDERLAHHLDPA